jgi:predicted membrane protein
MSFRYWFGAVLLAVGLGLLADQLYPALEIGRWLAILWPLAVVLLGLIILLTRSSTWIGGTLILVFGLFLQLITLGILGEKVWDLFFPVLLILIGILVIFRLGKPVGLVAKSADLVESFGIFSGYHLRPQMANFRGGSVTAVFGGTDLDLRESTLAPEGARLEVTAAFGGIELILPKGWRIDIDGIPFFGGWSNKSEASAAVVGPVLAIRCLAMFGGIEIKN